MKPYFLLPLLFLFFPCSAIEVSTNARLIDGIYYVVQGERVDVVVYGEPLQEVSVSVYYCFSVNSTDGSYLYSQSKFPIPLSADFQVRAYPVYNITVEAKLWIFTKKLEANARDSVAEVRASVPSGRYDVRIYGNSKAEVVKVEANAFARVKLGSDGRYSISYDTSKLPIGEMRVIADSKELKVKVVSSPPAPSKPMPTSTPTFTPTPTPAPAKPDLLIASIDCSPKQLIAGQQASIKVAVRNIGNADATAFNVSLLVNESKIAEQRVSGLKAGESEILTFSWTPAFSGNCTLKAIADSNGEIDESSEENNEMSCFATIKEPEMETAFGTPEAPKEERIPRIYLNRTSAYPLEEIEVSGKNFSGNVILKICGNECHEAANCSCFNGSFVCTLKTPKIAGNYSLIAEDSFGARAEERIRVVERERGIPGFEALIALIALILASRRFR
ncbi:MAG: hypothetical protein DSO00_02315 [Archaeoglobi archaeon]|nr:MAG: hypothetical protein DSO00_02315 [Archaeoglobi archaeon]